MNPRKRGRLVACAVGLVVSLAAVELSAKLTDTRTISLRNIHTDETITVEYKRRGRYVPEAMERVNWVMRDWRRNETTRMDPALVDLLWEMHRELGSKAPINIISGYRSRTTNNMLRRTSGGQASQSRHILGKAADVNFPDVSVRHVRYAAMIRERGGVGYYPTSATPFVHVDTDGVRAWPRMPRFELALLFPNGHTRHTPAEGGPLTSEDVRIARSRQPEVARHLAAFHDIRRQGPAERPSLMAALAPGAGDIVFTPGPVTRPTPTPAARAAAPQPPTLVSAPRLADRPSRLSARASEDDRRRLTQLVALAGTPALVSPPRLVERNPTPKRKGHDAVLPAAGQDEAHGGFYPRLAFLCADGIRSLQGWSTGFTQSPAWDEDHPEEAAYRPFPLAPFLTTTVSIDDPALVKLVHPDLARTGELFDTSAGTDMLRLRPAGTAARLLWAQEESGRAVDLYRLSIAANEGTHPRASATRRASEQIAR